MFAWVGIHLTPDTFIAVAGAVELLFGLLVVSAAMPQVAALVAAVPFNATLALFGQTELVGHLPVYGVFLAMLAYGSNARTAPLVAWLTRLPRLPRLPRLDQLRELRPSRRSPSAAQPTKVLPEQPPGDTFVSLARQSRQRRDRTRRHGA